MGIESQNMNTLRIKTILEELKRESPRLQYDSHEMFKFVVNITWKAREVTMFQDIVSDTEEQSILKNEFRKEYIMLENYLKSNDVHTALALTTITANVLYIYQYTLTGTLQRLVKELKDTLSHITHLIENDSNMSYELRLIEQLEIMVDRWSFIFH